LIEASILLFDHLDEFLNFVNFLIICGLWILHVFKLDHPELLIVNFITVVIAWAEYFDK
jgi:hypothetical protein